MVALAFLFAAAAFAACPSTAPRTLDGGAQTLKVGYRYSFETDKNLANPGQISIQLPTVATTSYLYIHFDPLSTTSASTDYNFKLGFDAFPNASDALTPLDCDTVNRANCKLFFPITNQSGGVAKISLKPVCSSCIKTSEWAFETAITSNSSPEPYGYQPFNLEFQQRTTHIHTTTANDPYVNFQSNFASAGKVYFRVDAKDEATGVEESGAQFRLFYSNTATYPTATTYNLAYPEIGAVTGSLKMNTGFSVNAGVGTFSVQTVRDGTGSTTVDWSLKAGLNEYPCDSAFTASASLLAVLAPLFLLFGRF